MVIRKLKYNKDLVNNNEDYIIRQLNFYDVIGYILEKLDLAHYPLQERVIQT